MLVDQACRTVNMLESYVSGGVRSWVNTHAGSLGPYWAGRAPGQPATLPEDWAWEDQAEDPGTPGHRGCGLLREGGNRDIWKGGALRESVEGKE